jgi:WD40 repeat protein
MKIASYSFPPFRIYCFLFLGFCLAFSGLAANAEESEDSRFRESMKLLATIPEGASIVSESVTARPKQEKIAYVYEDKQGFKVCLNGECSSPVDKVAQGMPLLSPNGKHWAAMVQKDGEVRLMLNGQMSKAYDMIHGVEFSPDSMQLAYIAQQGEKFFVNVNQKRHDSYAVIDARQGLMYSSDSEHLAYVASRDEKSWHLVLDGEPGPEYGRIKHVTFSPDSSRLAYAAKKGGSWHIVEDGKTGPGFKDIKRVAFSPDSESLAYIARSGDGDLVVRDGQESDTFDAVTGELVFSPGGERLAYSVAERTGDKVRMRVVVDGEAGPAYEKVGAYLFSPDGEEYAYMAVEEGKGLIVHNGKKHEAYDSVGIPVFGPRDRQLAYSVFRDGTWRVKKNGETGPGFDSVNPPLLSAAGSMAYLARQGPLYEVVKDQEILGTYKWAGLLQYGPDGAHLAYAAAKEAKKSFLSIDGQEGQEKFFSFLRGSSLAFTSDKAVQGIALREKGREFWLIRAEMENG